MKKIFVFILWLQCITVVSCKSKDQQDAGKSANEVDQTGKKNDPAPASAAVPARMENILGEWKLDRRLRDDNGNHVIDGDEEKTALRNTGGYMKLNSDGTCKFETVMDGTYQIVTGEEGRKKIEITDLQGTKYPVTQYIVSVTDRELVINQVAGGSGFDVYKRP